MLVEVVKVFMAGLVMFRCVPVRGLWIVAYVSCYMLAGCESDPIDSVSQSSIHASNLCELQALESVGYRPTEDDFYYPRNLEAAQARLSAQRRARGLGDADTCGSAKR